MVDAVLADQSARKIDKGSGENPLCPVGAQGGLILLHPVEKAGDRLRPVAPLQRLLAQAIDEGGKAAAALLGMGGGGKGQRKKRRGNQSHWKILWLLSAKD